MVARGASARGLNPEAETILEPEMTPEKLKQLREIESAPMKAQLKYLDRKTTAQGKLYYTETTDEKTPEQVNWWQKYALCLTRYLYNNGNVQKVTLQINSEHLKKVLKETITSYPGISFLTKDITIDLPCRVLYHYRRELIDAEKQLEKGSQAAEHLGLLLQFIHEQFGETIEETDNLREQGLINYQNIWTAFRPGSVVFSAVSGSMQAFTLNSYGWSCNPPSFDLSVTYVDFDGQDFGTRTTMRRIYPFIGAMRFDELAVTPRSLHHARDAIESTLIQRGRCFESYAGVHFAEYQGVAVQQAVGRVKADGRCVIDAKTFHRLNPNWAYQVNTFTQGTEDKLHSREGGLANKSLLCVNHESGFSPLTDEQCLLASGMVRGFSFAEKEWLDFSIDNLAPIDWNSQCFDQLVLPERHKNVVRALVSDHIHTHNNFDDIVKGKGRGLVLVLHGPPGVGKTLTAECVAEYTRRPLYIVSSGDLGTSSSTLDDRLSRILDMASTWKAVLLIDEADVFLEARCQRDLERNALVSIFLRVLEYYQGIMFLTTNRVETFDDAFKSRIHVPLKYSDLSSESRVRIWKNFLANIEGGVAITESEYHQLGAAELNGRQIKNVIRTAKSLARHDNKRLDLDMLEQVIEIQMEFENHLHSGVGAPEIASRFEKEAPVGNYNGFQ